MTDKYIIMSDDTPVGENIPTLTAEQESEWEKYTKKTIKRIANEMRWQEDSNVNYEIREMARKMTEEELEAELERLEKKEFARLEKIRQEADLIKYEE